MMETASTPVEIAKKTFIQASPLSDDLPGLVEQTGSAVAIILALAFLLRSLTMLVKVCQR